MTDLAGRRILVVEDEALVAAMVADMLEDRGATVVGPATYLEEGVALARAEDIHAGVLDVNLRGERIDPVAEALASRGIPFVFATGYGAAPAGKWEAVATVDKPYSIEKLASALLRALGNARP